MDGTKASIGRLRSPRTNVERHVPDFFIRMYVERVASRWLNVTRWWEESKRCAYALQEEKNGVERALRVQDWVNRVVVSRQGISGPLQPVPPRMAEKGCNVRFAAQPYTDWNGLLLSRSGIRHTAIHTVAPFVLRMHGVILRLVCHFCTKDKMTRVEITPRQTDAEGGDHALFSAFRTVRISVHPPALKRRTSADRCVLPTSLCYNDHGSIASTSGALREKTGISSI